jgi:hypothetical protein
MPVLKGLEEVNKYSLFLPSSLLVVKLTSVERMDSAILFLLLAACLSRLQLPFECINFFKKESQRLLSRSSFGFKTRIFLLFELANYFEISHVMVVLVTIVIPHVVLLRILRRLVYTSGNRLLIIYQ